MELFDLTKQAVNNLLPRKHQAALAFLLAALFIIPVAMQIRESRQVFVHRSDQVLPTARPVIEPRAAEVEPDSRLKLEVGSGDNLSILFNKAGLGAQDVLAITSSTEDKEALSDLYPGDGL